MKYCLLLFFLVIGFFAGNAQSEKVKSKDLVKLVKIMAGEFSSEKQSIADTDYYHIKLRMKPMWQDSKDGYWLYVEQAMSSAEQRPYRQRVYHVYKQDDTTIVSKVYELKTPKNYIGSWQDASKLVPLTLDSLVDRQGCSIYLHKHGKTFTGSTPGSDCLSSLRGATYATSEVTVCDDKLISWDRGWDKAGKQMWGAEKGGYVFDRIRSIK